MGDIFSPSFPAIVFIQRYLGTLHTLTQIGLKTLCLNYIKSKRTDEYGNQFRYRAKAKDDKDAQLGRWAWDVFLTVGP